MACARRYLTTNYTHHLARRLPPSVAHVIRDDDNGSSEPPKPPTAFHSRCGDPAAPSRPVPRLLCGRRSSLGLALPFGVDPSLLLRRYSSSAEGLNEVVHVVNDPAEVLLDGSVEAAAAAVAAAVPPAPFPGEVAAAAADSFLPVWALQHVIDGIHSFTGLNWWASIALTTILIRGATVPLLVNQMKASLKLSLMRPELEQLKEQMNSMDPQSVQESQKKMQALFKKHGVTPFTPLKGILFQGPIFISFFFAISNMVEKVPSLKGGGAFWFTDLTTPDPQYIFPVLTALSFLATVELNMQEGMEGNPMAKNMKNFSRVMALMTVPFTAHFPKAIFCYWITSNIFSLLYGFVLRRPPVRKILGLPELVPQPASSSPPNFSFLTGHNSSGPSNSSLSAKESEQSKTPERKVSSSSVISQRIRNLEKTVKARNIKPKKR